MKGYMAHMITSRRPSLERTISICLKLSSISEIDHIIFWCWISVAGKVGANSHLFLMLPFQALPSLLKIHLQKIEIIVLLWSSYKVVLIVRMRNRFGGRRVSFHHENGAKTIRTQSRAIPMK